MLRTDVDLSPSRYGAQRSLLRELVLLVGLTLLLATLVRTFGVQPFYIPSGSMENTLQVGDRVLVDKVSYRLHDVRRGDIVVFNGLDSFTPETHVKQPTSPLAKAVRTVGSSLGIAPPGEQDFIKRVIGVPGDRVKCCDTQGRVTVNGSPLAEWSYLYPGNTPSGTTFDQVVPEGRLWVMGDHRAESADSRSHLGDPGGGTVPESKVIGRAFSVVWPPSHWSGLGVPATYDEVRAPSALAPAAPYALGLAVALPSVMGRRRRRAGSGGQRP